MSMIGVGVSAGYNDHPRPKRKARQGTGVGYVYFVQMPEGGPIKIGRAEDPVRRLNGLQSGSPVELEMLLLVRNSQLEPAFHEKFWNHRIRGEWFYPADELADFISLVIQASTGTHVVNGHSVPVSDYYDKDFPSIRSSCKKAIADREAMFRLNGSMVPREKVLELVAIVLSKRGMKKADKKQAGRQEPIAVPVPKSQNYFTL